MLEADVESVVMPAHDGMIGILPQRAPLVCEVGIGVMRLSGGEVGNREFFIDGGFARVLDNEVTVLTTQAMTKDEVNRAAASTALDAAHQMRITDDASFNSRQKAIARAEAQLKLAS